MDNLKVVTLKSNLRLRRRTVIKFWVQRALMPRPVRRMVERIEHEMELEFLFGKCSCSRGRICARCLWRNKETV